MKNEITAILSRSKQIVTAGRYQYDYGQKLIIKGVHLPETYEVHFSNGETEAAKTQIGDNTGVEVPDEYFLTGKDVYAWLYLHEGNADGRTLYKIRIPVKKRPSITDAQPTPVQQDALTRAIAILNSASSSAYPRIVDDMWQVWDDDNKEWVETEFSSKGDKGDRGDKGEKGDKGDTVTAVDPNSDGNVVLQGV